MRTSPTPRPAQAADRALRALEDVALRDELAGTRCATVAVRGALRACFEKTPEERQAIDHLCAEIQTWFQPEIHGRCGAKAH